MPGNASQMHAVFRHALLLGSAAVAALRAIPHHVTGTRSEPHILVLRPDHLGDVLLSTPALSALRAAYPRARITALVGPWSAAVLSANSAVDDVHVFDFPGFSRSRPTAPWQAYWGLVELARTLRRWHVDMAINLRPDFWWGASALALAGVPIRIGFDVAPGDRTLTHRQPWPGVPEHSALLNLRLSELATRIGRTAFSPGIPLDLDHWPLTFPISAEDRSWAMSWLLRHGIAESNPPLFLHPGAGAPVKLWTADRWARTLLELAQHTGAPVVIGGPPTESAVVHQIATLLPNSVRVATCVDEIPLARYAALIGLARLALGVDSGPLHLAVAVGTPSVRLHGPSDPRVFGPWGRAELHAIVRLPLSCAPCGRLDYEAGRLPFHPCVPLIHPDLVVRAARSVLSNAQAVTAASSARDASPARRMMS